MELFDYQKVGRDFLSSRATACLWDEPGLGKSFQSLAAAVKLGAKDVNIICPASVRMVWRAECEKLGLDGRIVTEKKYVGNGIQIFSYEAASGKLFEDIYSHKGDMLIVDEGHYLKGFNSRNVKNPKTGRIEKHPPLRVEKIFGRQCDRRGSLSEKVTSVWSLTGTPMPNNPSELWPTIHALFPDAIMKKDGTPMGYWDFVYKYCVTVDNGFGTQITGGKNLNDLRDRLRGRILRRKKADVLKDLPEIRYYMLPVEGNLRGIDVEQSEVITECLRNPEPMEHLRKIAGHVASLRRITGMAKVESVIKWVEESGFKKVVLFAYHTDVINGLRKLEGSVYIDGSCTQAQREKAVRDFQEGDAKVFIGQINAAGTGITLTAANVLMFVETSWVPAENKQAADRIHRIGQKDSCLVYFASIPKSVDEDIIKVIKRKVETYRSMGL